MQPWCTGPSEILEHGLSLLEDDNDRNRRLAMIAIDNAVELTIKTFIGLPKRVTGLSISRQKYSQVCESFPLMLDTLEQNAAEKLEGINLGEVEWYHRLRNQLYHQGNGLTVERVKVEVYSELSKLLLHNLFDIEIKSPKVKASKLLGLFLSEWVELERNINKLSRQYRSGLAVSGSKLPPPMSAFQGLVSMGILSKKLGRRVDYYKSIRNRLVHGEGKVEELIDQNCIKEVREFQKEIKGIVESSK